MDISALKDALGDEKFAELESHVNDLKSQRDQARTESISGRRQLKERVQTLESQSASLLEKLGIDSIEDIEDLPDAKGAAEAAKQYEAKLNRATRELEETKSSLSEAQAKIQESHKKMQITEALGSHEWLAKDVVESFIAPRLEFEGDQLLYKTEDGKHTSVKDGVAELAKARPELLKPAGAGGAGVGSRGARGSQGTKEMSRADFDALSPDQRLEVAKQGVELH